MVRCSAAKRRSHEPYNLLAPQGDTLKLIIGWHSKTATDSFLQGTVCVCCYRAFDESINGITVVLYQKY